MICIKFDQKIKKPKKPKFWTFEVFRFFKKNLKNLVFFEAIFQPWSLGVSRDCPKLVPDLQTTSLCVSKYALCCGPCCSHFHVFQWASPAWFVAMGHLNISLIDNISVF